MTLQPIRRQRGATLVMGIIFLTLLMLTVTIAFRMSNNNLKAVGNMQSQVDAEGSAERAIEKLISSDTVFITPAASNVAADVYGVSVAIATPTCTRMVLIDTDTSGDSQPNIYLKNVVPASSSPFAETHWDIKATATGGATGARVEMHQGVRLVLPADPNPCP
jgi:Tfp pilus assembly protein PilX